jgi:aspartate/methionine/tyrosine aminotransferase
MRPFASRTDVDRTENELTRRVRALAEPPIDLTVSNPTTADLPYDAIAIRAALSDPAIVEHAPAAFGLESARLAVADVYRERGVAIDPSRILLTASTSEAYAHLFRLLVEPSGTVLVPSPSYPLFESIARYADCRLERYALVYDGSWRIDLDSVQTNGARAIVVVSPNNPTGSFLTRRELDALVALGLPLIVDEVFADYAFETPDLRSALEADGLVFVLSGLSKLAALPQLKLGWIAVGGPPQLATEAIARLELVLDTFLSVNTPVQVGLRALLAASEPTRAAIEARLRENYGALGAALRASAGTVLRCEGGWYATLRLPAIRTDEAWALEILERERVLVQPGYFFDAAPEPVLVVVSLLCPPASFREGVARLRRAIDAAA